MGTIALKAAVLFAGKGCPVCGEKKTAEARTCRTCYSTLGREVTRRVDAVTRAARAARNGHLAFQVGDEPVARDVIWGPILAQVRIGKAASFRQPGNGIKPYRECRKAVKGGFVPLFVFGAEYYARAGETITALVELKEKDIFGGKVSYLRAQAVQGVRSDVKLVIGQYDDANYISDLPSTKVVEQGRRFSVGFVSA